MFHALIYNSKNIRRNKKYYAYIFVYFPLCQYMYAVYLDFFTNLEIGVPFKKHAIEERKIFENILWKNCHFSILKNHRNRIDFLRIFLMGNIDVFFSHSILTLNTSHNFSTFISRYFHPACNAKFP